MFIKFTRSASPRHLKLAVAVAVAIVGLATVRDKLADRALVALLASPSGLVARLVEMGESLADQFIEHFGDRTLGADETNALPGH